MVTPRKPVHKHKIRCNVCSHPERHRIESLRLAGTAVDALAEKFGVGRDPIYRHMASHVDAEMKAALIADVPLRDLISKATAETGSLLDYLTLIRSTVVGQMLGAASVNDRAGTAKLAGRAVEVLQEIGRLTGELMASAPVQHITNNTAVLLSSPGFDGLQRMLIERLAPFPEALQAVLDGLDALDRQQVPQSGSLIALSAGEGYHAVAV